MNLLVVVFFTIFIIAGVLLSSVVVWLFFELLMLILPAKNVIGWEHYTNRIRNFMSTRLPRDKWLSATELHECLWCCVAPDSFITKMLDDLESENAVEVKRLPLTKDRAQPHKLDEIMFRIREDAQFQWRFTYSFQE